MRSRSWRWQSRLRGTHGQRVKARPRDAVGCTAYHIARQAVQSQRHAQRSTRAKAGIERPRRQRRGGARSARRKQAGPAGVGLSPGGRTDRIHAGGGTVAVEDLRGPRHARQHQAVRRERRVGGRQREQQVGGRLAVRVRGRRRRRHHVDACARRAGDERRGQEQHSKRARNHGALLSGRSWTACARWRQPGLGPTGRPQQSQEVAGCTGTLPTAVLAMQDARRY